MSFLTRRVLVALGGAAKKISLASTETSVLALQKVETQSFECFRVSESNPASHGENQIMGYYTVPQSEEFIFQQGLPKQFANQCTTFTETSFMIRQPALEIIDYLKKANYDNPPIKYVLHGRAGVGKSITVAHVVHFAHKEKWMILNCPWVGRWFRSPSQVVVNSATRPGLVDIPTHATRWLLLFKSQNQALIKELDLRLSKNYEWSQRETSSAGDSLLDIVELGLNRSRHTAEVIMAIVIEVKEYSRQGRFKTLVAIDGINAFFYPNTIIRNEHKVVMPPSKITLTLPFFEATKCDWHNAAMVLVCDELAVSGRDKSPSPLYQLGIDGFHYFNPFVPIHVPNMTDAELRSMLSYYRERRWLQDWQADNELVFLAAGNPYKMMHLCNPL